MAIAAPIRVTPRSSGDLVALTYEAGDATVIALSGDLRPPTVAALDDRLTEALDRGRRHLVLDLHMLRSLDSGALDVLWGALRRVNRRDGTLAAAGTRESLRPALEPLTPRGLTLHGTVHAALAGTSPA